MRNRALIAVVACSLTGLVPAAGAVVPGRSATAAVSTDVAGAHPVALTVGLTYEMQCGSPGPGPVTLTLPDGMSAPARIAKASVLVDGKAAPSLGRSGAKILVGLPAQPRIMCDSITTGTLTIVLTKAAGIANPKRAGTYSLQATRGSLAFSARLRIR